eukprot:gene28233-31334_t
MSLMRSSSIVRRAQQLKALDDMLVKGANLDAPVKAPNRPKFGRSLTFTATIVTVDPADLIEADQSLEQNPPSSVLRSMNRSMSMDCRRRISNSGSSRYQPPGVPPVFEAVKEGEDGEDGIPPLTGEGFSNKLENLDLQENSAPVLEITQSSPFLGITVTQDDSSPMVNRRSRLQRVSTAGHNDIEFEMDREEEMEAFERARPEGEEEGEKEEHTSKGSNRNPWAPLPGPCVSVGVVAKRQSLELAAT